MPMNPNFLCCIGAELKNSTQQTTRMSQVYFYRAFEEETVADMLQPGFFDAAMGIVRQDDLLLLYDPKDESARWTYCRVSNVDRSGVEISLMGVNAKDVFVEIPGDDPITLQSLIDNTIMPAIENIGDMDLPVITDGGTAPTNLSEAIRQIVTQDLTLTEDSVEPESGQFSLWGAIKKALENAKNFFSSISNLDTRLNALEGQGGPVGSYDFGKSFPNILDATDTQLVAGVMVDNIWAGHTPIVWTTPIANSTFTDGDGVDRTVGEIFNGTWIINSYDGTRIVLTNTPNTTPPIFSYQNVGVYSVGFANATTAGVVRVGTGSDMTVDQATGDISIDNTKGYSIFHRLISLFTGTQKTQIRSDLNAASRDMNDLSATGQNIANWSSNVTNCITNIPQDIKLELGTGDNAGKMILKAGSKAYVPNGSGVFNTVVIPNDIILTASSNYTRALFLTANGGTDYITIDRLYSGTTAPTGFTGTAYWYDTTNNVIKVSTDSGSTWSIPSSKKSFPLALFTTTSGAITSIDQVFNGFGYIGSTVFALPGLEYLCPNGRNADGTLNNTKNKLTTCVVRTETNTSFSGKRVINITGGGTIILDSLERWFVQEQEPPRTNYNVWENPATNEIYQYLDGVWNKRTSCVLGIITETTGKIDSFSRKQVFRTVDYNDTEYIAHQAMPSDKYVNLTLGASGSSYTAPADGYFTIAKKSGGAGEYLTMESEITSSGGFSTGTNMSFCCNLPVRKGHSMKIWYSASGAVVYFRFVYANGAK